MNHSPPNLFTHVNIPAPPLGQPAPQVSPDPFLGLLSPP